MKGRNSGVISYRCQKPVFESVIQKAMPMGLTSAIEAGRNGGPRPIDEAKLWVEEGFADVMVIKSDSASLTIRAGRQELSEKAHPLTHIPVAIQCNALEQITISVLRSFSPVRVLKSLIPFPNFSAERQIVIAG